MSDFVLLFDDYGMESQNLHSSFILTGYDCPVIVIDETGFLPENVVSVYGSYLGDYSKQTNQYGKPRYFNQVDVPDYWEITANSRNGVIHDKNHERGYINYTEPSNKRLVNSVDWTDETGVRRISNFYNQYGALYAKTIYDVKGKAIHKSYFIIKPVV